MEALLESAFGYWMLPALIFTTVLTMVAYLVYSGLVTSIEVSAREPAYGDLVVAYKTGRGPYKTAGDLFTNAYLHCPDRECVGIYYDDPEAVPAEELRYAVGTILAQGDKETPVQEEMERMVADGFKIAHFPSPNYAVVTDFPFRTTISIYLAIFRVYPKLKEYISSRGLCAYPAVEIYSTNVIHFMMPLSRQEEWFVPEFSEDEVSIATTEMSTDSRFQQKDDPGQAKRVDVSSDDGGGDNREEGRENDDDVFVKPEGRPEKRRSDHSRKASSEGEPSDSTASEFEDLSNEAATADK